MKKDQNRERERGGGGEETERMRNERIRKARE